VSEEKNLHARSKSSSFTEDFVIGPVDKNFECNAPLPSQVAVSINLLAERGVLVSFMLANLNDSVSLIVFRIKRKTHLSFQ
jgi:hypothetical protein